MSLATGPERTGPLTGPGLDAAARTNRGPREGNEDTYVCRPDLGLFAAIDGMGGQMGGERAAALAREALLASTDLLQAIRNANEQIHQLAEKETALRGMGCVASALRVEETGARIIHVGDTRVYLAGRAGCEQLTRDHTVAARRQEDQGISAPAARGIPGHNQVTRDIGGKPQKDDGWVDRLQVDLEAGDLLMLCSDGLHGAVPAADLFARLRRARKEDVPPVDLVDSLIDLALKNGTKDNVTVVVARYTPGNKPWWGRDVKELFNKG